MAKFIKTWFPLIPFLKLIQAQGSDSSACPPIPTPSKKMKIVLQENCQSTLSMGIVGASCSVRCKNSNMKMVGSDYLSCILNDVGFAEWDKQLPRCITTKQRGSKQPSATIDSSDSGLGGLGSPNSMQANEKQAVSIEIDRKRRRKNKSSKKKKVKTNKKKKTPVVVVTTTEATTTTDFSTADLFGSDTNIPKTEVLETNFQDTDVPENNLDTSAVFNNLVTTGEVVTTEEKSDDSDFIPNYDSDQIDDFFENDQQEEIISLTNPGQTFGQTSSFSQTPNSDGNEQSVISLVNPGEEIQVTRDDDDDLFFNFVPAPVETQNQSDDQVNQSDNLSDNQSVNQSENQPSAGNLFKPTFQPDLEPETHDSEHQADKTVLDTDQNSESNANNDFRAVVSSDEKEADGPACQMSKKIPTGPGELTCPAGRGSWNGNPAIAGAVCTIICDPGYKPTISKVTCGPKGNWVERRRPRCQVDPDFDTKIIENTGFATEPMSQMPGDGKRNEGANVGGRELQYAFFGPKWKVIPDGYKRGNSDEETQGQSDRGDIVNYGHSNHLPNTAVGHTINLPAGQCIKCSSAGNMQDCLDQAQTCTLQAGEVCSCYVQKMGGDSEGKVMITRGCNQARQCHMDRYNALYFNRVYSADGLRPRQQCRHVRKSLSKGRDVAARKVKQNQKCISCHPRSFSVPYF